MGSFREEHIPDLHGKVAVVTGSNTGLGFHTALTLASKGAEVVITARSKTKGEAALADITAQLAGFDAKIRFLQLDLASLPSVKAFADAFSATGLPLHMLVLNAGIMGSPFPGFGQNFALTEQGFESHIGTNYIGHFFLTQLLEPLLRQTQNARVVQVTSAAEAGAYPDGLRFDSWTSQDKDYDDGHAYSESSLARVLFAQGLAARLEDSSVTVRSCHPGIIDTSLGDGFLSNMEAKLKKNMGGIVGAVVYQLYLAFWKSAVFSKNEHGALTQLYLATAPELDQASSGKYFHPIGKMVPPEHGQARNVTLQKLMWQHTEALLKARAPR